MMTGREAVFERALEEIANADHRGPVSTEMSIARRALKSASCIDGYTAETQRLRDFVVAVFEDTVTPFRNGVWGEFPELRDYAKTVHEAKR